MADEKVKIRAEAPFSEDIFEITKVLLGDPVVYKLRTEEFDYELGGIFYEQELSLVRK